MCWFSIEPVTNYCMFSGLKQHNFIIVCQIKSLNRSHWAEIKVSHVFFFGRRLESLPMADQVS